MNQTALKMSRIAAVSAAVILFLAQTASAQAPADSASGYAGKSYMVPMRDGARLHTLVYEPEQAGGQLPFMMVRTPYGIDGRFKRDINASLKKLGEDGYIFVLQDIRGRFESEGQFVMLRPLRDPDDTGAVDEATDTYDTIEWLLENVPNHNGRVGMMGVSYPGWLVAMALLDPHPALRAASPQASPSDMFLGDDFHHKGAFRLSYGFEYVTRMETSKTNFIFQFDRYDTYDWYLDLGPLSNADALHLHGAMPTWNDFTTHPNYDDFWQRQAFNPEPSRVTVPTLNVAGWWDQEDFYGPLKIYELFERIDPDNLNCFVAGPWNHGGWSSGNGDKLGAIAFDSPTSWYYRELIQAPWFAHHLKDRENPNLPEALTFRTGVNTWVRYNAWPPEDKVTVRNLYFHPGGKLSFNPPDESGDKACDSYASDPAKPVPYRKRPVQPTYFSKGSGWGAWQTEDQRFVDGRPDVLTWQTVTLDEDVTVSGTVIARLFASTTGTDSDWIVKLIDVYPDDYPSDHTMGGYQLMIAGDVLRGRFRKSFEKPEKVKSGAVEEYAVDLLGHDHTFLKGHRIMVQVQSTWFPIIDRNPQTYVDNIFEAREEDFKAATQCVYRNRKYPSHIELPVMSP